MKSLLSTSLLVRQWVHWTQCLNHSQARCMGRSAEAHAIAVSHNTVQLNKLAVPPTFETVGLRPPIVAALHAAFPNVRHPTEAQVKFIPAVLSGRDVLLKDDTGSGKSFGLIMALLSKPRLRFKESPTDKAPEKPSITSLVIVPHRDLAYQLLHWIERMTNSPAVRSPPPVSSIAQVMIRDGVTHVTSRLLGLRSEPPHILIGTPQALLDVWEEDPAALQLSSLSSVLVDEVDYLIDSVPIKDSKKSFYKAFLKAKQKIAKHPSATGKLLDIIYAARKEASEHQYDDVEVSQPRMPRAGYSELRPPPNRTIHTPQLIMSSATLRKHLDLFLFKESGWLQKNNLVKVKQTKLDSSRNSLRDTMAQESKEAVVDGSEDAKNDGLGGREVSHSVLVISQGGDIANIAGAVRGAADPQEDAAASQPITPQTIFASSTAADIQIQGNPRLAEKYAGTPSPFNPSSLEAIATAFALDVPSIALLVLPSSAPVQRAVHELCELGVNARGLDLLAADKGRAHLSGGGDAQENPTLLVSTLATTRGLDLPHLTHVFILGIPEGPKINGRTIDAYLHIAGRVGRFGRGGKVITVVEKGEEPDGDEVTSAGKDAASKMQRIFREIKVTPVLFEHFD